MRSKILIAAGGALLFAAALVGCGKKPPPPPPPAVVGYAVVKSEPVTLSTELPGRTAAYVTAEVRPQVNGVIRTRTFTEGADVRAGQLLFEIDPAPYRASLGQAQAQLANAQANVATQKVKFERYADLVKINAVSKQDADDARAAYGQAVANVSLAREQVRAAAVNLGYTRVTSPVSGRIGRAAVTQGGLATAGQTQALATVQQLDPIYVDVAQSADELLKLKRDIAGGKLEGAGPQSVDVRLALSDGSQYPTVGRLRFSEAQVDPTTGSVTLRAIFPNPNRTLLPGMYVRAQIGQAVDATGVRAPQGGVQRNETGDATGMVVGAKGGPESRVIKTGPAIGSNWLVTDGLKPGDKLIVEGLAKLQGPPQPGAPPPKVVPASASAQGAGGPGGKPAAQGAGSAGPPAPQPASR